MHVDTGEDLRVRGGALRGELNVAARDVLTAFLEDDYDVVGAAAAGAEKHHFHRPRGEVAAAALRRAVHCNDVIAAGLGEERHALAGPTNRAVHRGFPWFVFASAFRHLSEEEAVRRGAQRGSIATRMMPPESSRSSSPRL